MNKLMFLVIALFSLTEGIMAGEKLEENGVGIEGHFIAMPVGRLLLIGRNDFIGVIKFIENKKRTEGMYSKYSYYEYEGGSIKKMREGVISLKEPSRGFWAKLMGFLSFHDDPFRYADKIEFNKFELFAHAGDEYHSSIYFWNRPNEIDPKVRMAPTPWTQIEEVELSDPRIKWFGYDEKRKWKVIPIDKIWD